MKKPLLLTVLLASLTLLVCGQNPAPSSRKASTSGQSLLWRISGNGLQKPSYLFGTMHMLCGDDIYLSDSLRSAIASVEDVYLELDMDNLFEMLGAMQHMKMRDDTTLADLLTPLQYKKVKTYFKENSALLPFSMLESFKPMLAASLIGEQQIKSSCEKMVVMDQLVMQEAKAHGKNVKGLESIKYQLNIFDKIPYKTQAEQLYQMITQVSDTTSVNDLVRLTNVYKSQNLEKLEEITVKEDVSLRQFADLLLYQRNENWTKKMTRLMAETPVVVAVGAGHLPGKRGVIQLLRQAGYTVEPVKNDMIKRKTRAI